MQSSLHGGVEAKGIVATARTDGVDSSRCGSLRLLVRVQHPHRVGVQRSPQHLSLPAPQPYHETGYSSRVKDIKKKPHHVVHLLQPSKLGDLLEVLPVSNKPKANDAPLSYPGRMGFQNVYYGY
ncbi:uncharacterized protein LOC124157957 isoform X1 [Ischnura elegans]|uniref:uncharacterized protein LOC124157957 isoform X1 n=1 Tax=Ischnura elegans TaxID=197161 RepID=UPI001ED894E2|nr:uncharacterized protein LOC124157957 isoform X1 [Ischnura elegans]